MLPKAVTEYLLAHRDRHLAELCELLAIPSMATVPDGACAAAAEWVRARLERLGLGAQVVFSAGSALRSATQSTSPPNVLAEAHGGEDRPTLLVYGHYDVQPPDPLEAWETPPFSPQVRGGCLYARGASDDKGQLFAHLMAVEAWQHAGGLPVNLKVFIEGEEEIGSPHLEGLGLAARVVEAGGPPNVIATAHVDDRLPTLLVYGHYDVQPPDPLEQWRTDPFEPAVAEGCVFG
ncbi:MAG: M20/M25/M40 family metallo-hydrolase, partial [Phycisphaerae bacterium]|nr:M20/M25/M40 family metallo-hydrolase [Phycisphaerae bacterium]